MVRDEKEKIFAANTNRDIFNWKLFDVSFWLLYLAV